MNSILITGGTGMIGTALSRHLLQHNYRVIILTRNPSQQKSTNPNLSYAYWDTHKQEIDQKAIAGADAIVHLAGANIAEKRWTDKRKKEIRDSRVMSGNLLVKSMREQENRIKAVISASAIGYYGDDSRLPAGREEGFIETDPPAPGFLGETCEEWEASIRPAAQMNKRLVILRFGVVLSKKGGMMESLVSPMKFGIAGIPGDGKQVLSWIHIDDLVRLIRFALEKEGMEGTYNAVSPNPVELGELVKTIAKKRGKFYLPVKAPSFLLRMALGEMSEEVLKSARVSAGKMRREGFEFGVGDVGLL